MSQSQATALKQKASELPCLFVDLVEKYSKVRLRDKGIASMAIC